MLRELSVRDNVEYSARVRLPPSWTNAEISAHVDATLAALSLAHVQVPDTTSTVLHARTVSAAPPPQ